MLKSLGIIIFTGDDFDISKKFRFLLRCVNSIQRQNRDNVKIVVLSKDEIDSEYCEKFPPNLQVKTAKDTAKGLNECIRELDCSHILIEKYDTIFSKSSLDRMFSLSGDDGMIFNYCAKTSNGEFGIEPILNKVNIASQFENFPFVYNMIFSKNIIVNNNLMFTDFKYADQYFFILKYYKAAKNIKFSNDILICLDRCLKIKFNFSNKFFLNNYKELFKIAKYFRNKKDTEMIRFMTKDFGITLLQRRYSEKRKKNRLFYLIISKYFMRILIGI